jgi:hypothetical protein
LLLLARLFARVPPLFVEPCRFAALLWVVPLRFAALERDRTCELPLFGFELAFGALV